ncbi:MAG: DNA mismatch repair protein MutS [Ruminiclostridium sp.]|nr:DNA mismatch repair protein MutS [Ruminiclostridium sp.]
MAFITLICAVLALFILFDIISNRNNNKRIKKFIAESWGRIPEYVPAKRDVESISSYFNNRKRFSNNEVDIDDITWNDLEMDKVFNRINATLSTAGEEYLYDILRRPVLDENKLQERSKLISFFQSNREEREKVQFLLAKLDKMRHIDVSDYFFGDGGKYARKPLYYLLAGILLLSTAVMIFVNIKIGAAVFALSLITNATVYYKIKNTIEYRLLPLGYIIRMISTANTLIKLKIPALRVYRDKLAESLIKVQKIRRRGFSLLTKAQNPITEYAKSLLFAELIAFESCHNIVVEYRTEIKSIFEILGCIDSMISIASFRKCIDFYCEPEFIERPEGEKQINAVDLYHPLVNEPVANTFSFTRPALITGSNASGKSTFLKTVAINTILAQTAVTCLAKKFLIPRLMIYTSMALKDNLTDNESYFIVELKSLKRIIDAINAGARCLCIIDEVLRGTNTIERIAASSEVLASLGNKNCMCLAATHDIELASILEGSYDNYHFREEVTGDNNVLFDYTLYRGKSSTKNALKLLKIMGYDNSIVSRAQARSDKFVREGVWEK